SSLLCREVFDWEMVKASPRLENGITGNGSTSADGPLTRGAATGWVREDHLCGRSSASMTASKVPSGSIQSKAALASCCAMTPSAYNGTPAQPQPQTMGAARRDPRRGEIPGGRRQTPVRMP